VFLDDSKRQLLKGTGDDNEVRLLSGKRTNCRNNGRFYFFDDWKTMKQGSFQSQKDIPDLKQGDEIEFIKWGDKYRGNEKNRKKRIKKQFRKILEIVWDCKFTKNTPLCSIFL